MKGTGMPVFSQGIEITDLGLVGVGYSQRKVDIFS